MYIYVYKCTYKYPRSIYCFPYPHPRKDQKIGQQIPQIMKIFAKFNLATNSESQIHRNIYRQFFKFLSISYYINAGLVKRSMADMRTQ